MARVIVCLLLAGFIPAAFSQCHGCVGPVQPVSCPSVVTEEHECYELLTRNITIHKPVYGPCPDSSSERSESSEEDDDRHDRHRRHGYRPPSPPDDQDMCVRMEQFTCVSYYCQRRCCDGWDRDRYTGRCTSPEESSCRLHCMNGGTCLSNDQGNRCLCRENFTGKRCETAICQNPCLHGGVCVTLQGRPRCSCPKGFYGPKCQYVRCERPCLNGGRCQAVGARAQCVCPRGFIGARCERREQSTCVINGTHYRIGQRFEPKPCTTCICIHPGVGMNGGAFCWDKTYMCPPARICEHGYEENQCCGVCKASQPVRYQAPLFLNCPRGVVTIKTVKNANYADLDLQLKAVDFQNKSMKVIMEGGRKFEYDPKQIHRRVHAKTEPDVREQIATCDFLVRVKDIHQPVYQSCPSDLFVYSDESASWEEPNVQDNVGVASQELRSNYPKESVFPIGEHVVIYIAVDFDGNEASCQFVISVFDVKDMGKPNNPEFLKSRDPRVKKYQYYIIAAAAIFALLLLFLVGFCLLRQCRKHRAAERVCRSNSTTSELSCDSAFDNAIYAIHGSKSPDYDSVIKSGLRDWNLIDSPLDSQLPLYETIGNAQEKKMGKEAFDNPAYAKIDDVVVSEEALPPKE